MRVCTARAEGGISELHIALKGTMGALYLKDLAAKTHRGLEGRIRQGRGTGTVPYGYRTIRRLRPDGAPDRGLREIDPEQTTIVRRIFADYAAGHSPRQIARALNADGIASPNGGVWTDNTIRSRAVRGEGNRTSVRYARVEDQIVDALRSRLMQPDLLASFATAFAEAWREQITQAAGNPD